MKSGTIGQLPEQLQSLVNIAYNNCERLVLLINDILDMDKIEAGEMVYNIEPIDAVELITDAIEANKGFGDEHGIEFVCSGIAEKVPIKGDRHRLMQVMSNLMSNAAKFSPSGEQVMLSVSHQGKTVCIAVKDNGSGIPQEHKESLFHKFTQVDSSDTREKGGTGLGLSITKAIVEHHGGVLDYESEVGIGSTFFFTLPAPN